MQIRINLKNLRKSRHILYMLKLLLLYPKKFLSFSYISATKLFIAILTSISIFRIILMFLNSISSSIYNYPNWSESTLLSIIIDTIIFISLFSMLSAAISLVYFLIYSKKYKFKLKFFKFFKETTFIIGISYIFIRIISSSIVLIINWLTIELSGNQIDILASVIDTATVAITVWSGYYFATLIDNHKRLSDTQRLITIVSFVMIYLFIIPKTI